MRIAVASGWTTGRDAPLLTRQPERLVVEGFRHWLKGYDTGSIDCWELGWALFAREIGPRDARRLLAYLSCWIRELRRASDRPFMSLPYGCPCLCRDECLVLGLVSALQHGDAETVGFASRHLLGDRSRDATIATARDFAEALDRVHQRLLPVPCAVVEDVAERPPTEMFH